ncbi:hypothetical protein [Kaistia adipata]|uniref:hypothetical protein n=1 Tax=Kaistia adipata TaxID=166954 RepID=UPI0012EBEDE3|nr:hypothetical protein [Kaistia adipata]
MSTNDTTSHGRPRRETAARGAFYVWIAAYAAVTIAIATIHGFGGTPSRAGEVQARQDAAAHPLDPTPVGSIHPVIRAGTGS